MVTPNPLFDLIQFNQAQFGATGAASFSGQTVRGLIYAALRKAAVTLAPGRGPSPAQMQDAIDELRRLTASLNCDRLFIYAEDIYTFPIEASKKIYTIGQSPDGTVVADFDAPRPQLLIRGNFIDTTDNAQPQRYPIAMLTPAAWAAITTQELADTIPQGLYNDRGYPISKLYLYGQPVATNGIELWVWHQIPTYKSESDAVILPGQYEDALVLNLACRLAPQFQKEVHPDVRDQARLSLMRLESINAPRPVARLFGLGCGSDNDYNIYNDTFE
jgi:hypothetical protein